ncbi:MAG TPA: sulfotransferase domain-containing protein [Anaerolineales bacterium]|nr:sulfotransferase domain-containing protein [Anaerolineales bacterium]
MDNPHNFKRPTSVKEMQERFENFATDEGWQHGLNYKPDPTDIFIVTPAKCGTTWMQQIVHGLRTRGSMDFDEISRVVPWINMAYDVGIDIYAPQVARPHAFKTHTRLDEVPKGGKYIVIVRDPGDALVSAYHFMEEMFFEKGTITLEEFAHEEFLPNREIHTHTLAFWDRRNDDDVLPLAYENMKSNLTRTIEQVAAFMDIPLDEELREIVLRQSDIKFMQEHKEQFEDHLIRKARSEAMRLPQDGQLNKVRNGQVGESRERVPEEIIKELDVLWQEVVTPKTGLHSYEDLRKELDR